MARKILYFDAFNGASGDMILGALIDMGLPLGHLRSELAKLGLDEFELAAEKIEREGLTGTDFHVFLSGSGASSQTEQGRGSADASEITVREHHHHPAGKHHHPVARTYLTIRKLIRESQLSAGVRERAGAVFERLAQAEAAVHRTSPEQVHFHEVGAVDAIVDIVGACIGFEFFGIEDFYSSPLSLGGGTVQFSHGTWPVPAPATLELVRGFPTRLGPVEVEMTTPTGAAIVTALVKSSDLPLSLSWILWGLGAGDRVLAGVPNMLRLLVGEAEVPASAPSLPLPEPSTEEVLVLEANVDDLDGESLGFFLEKALQSGVLDAFFTPVFMKKNRPGTQVTLLCRRVDEKKFVDLLFSETTTFGVRRSVRQRWCLDREIRTLQTELGEVRIKVGCFEGRTVTRAPEYEDLKRLAAASGKPLREVRQIIMNRLKDES